MMQHKVDYNIEFHHVFGEDFIDLEIDVVNIEKTLEIIDALESKGHTYSLNILVDDYTEKSLIKKDDIDIHILIDKIKTYGIEPDYIIMESDLCRLAEKFISYLPSKWKKFTNGRLSFINYKKNILLKKRVNYDDIDTDYIFLFLEEKNLLPRKRITKKEHWFDVLSDVTLRYKEKQGNRYSCVLLTACWHLHRLGIKEFSEHLPNTIKITRKSFFGKRSITVLSHKFLSVEANALDLISFLTKKSIKKASSKIEYLFY